MASNVALTTGTVVSNLSNSTDYDGLLKDVFLPYLHDTLFFDDSFTRMIQQRSDLIDFEGQRIVNSFLTQRSSNPGPISEGGDWRKSVPIAGKQGTEKLKYLNMYFCLSGPVIEAAKGGVGSMVNVVTKHFQTIVESAQLDLERQLMGAQNGKLASIVDTTVTGTGGTTAYDVEGDAFFDTQFLEPGQRLEFRDNVNGTATLRTLVDGTNNFNIVDRITKGSKGATRTYGTVVFSNDITQNLVKDDWIVREDAYTSGSASDCMEINGLLNLISDGATTTDLYDESVGTNFTHAWSLARSAQPYLSSLVQNVNGEINEDKLLDALIETKYQHQGRPNLLLCSPRAMKRYFHNSYQPDRRFNVLNAVDWVGGYKGLGIQLGDQTLMLTSLASVPKGYIFMLDTNDFAFASMTNGYQWKLGDGNRILTQSHTADKQFASAVNYLNFVCLNPGKQYKGYGVTE